MIIPLCRAVGRACCNVPFVPLKKVNYSLKYCFKMYYIFKNNTTLQQIKKQAIRTKGACFLKKQKKLGYEIKQQTP
jgi:hypothetical protein